MPAIIPCASLAEAKDILIKLGGFLQIINLNRDMKASSTALFVILPTFAAPGIGFSGIP